jgi:hypothetical protein
MRIIEISQKKQDNGLWGIPFHCIKMMENSVISPKKEVLHSAIVAAVNERFNNPFEVFMISDSGFAIQVYQNVYDTEESEMFYFRYSDYEIDGYKLYEFHSPEDDKEHIVFLRTQKLKKLENIF